MVFCSLNLLLCYCVGVVMFHILKVMGHIVVFVGSHSGVCPARSVDCCNLVFLIIITVLRVDCSQFFSIELVSWVSSSDFSDLNSTELLSVSFWHKSTFSKQILTGGKHASSLLLRGTHEIRSFLFFLFEHVPA